MSKSIGNVVDPAVIILGNNKNKPAYGADTLRWWVSNVDYVNDVCVGDNVIKQISESYRKLRNTFRFMLGNLNDFDPSLHAVPLDQLPSFDVYMLSLFQDRITNIEKYYDQFVFYKIHHEIMQFSANDLSSFYFDISKDRLYISSADDFRRRSCQTVLSIILERMCAVTAPILPFLAEDVWLNIPYKAKTQSVFENGWNMNVLNQSSNYIDNNVKWNVMIKLRSQVYHCIEQLRKQKQIGSSQEACDYLYTENTKMKSIIESLLLDDVFSKKSCSNGVDDLSFFFMVAGGKKRK